MSEFCLIIEMEVKPDAFERFLEFIAENARRSVADEPGCRQFDILSSPEQPNVAVLYEVYDDEAAFQAHMKTPHVAAFFGAARPLILKQTNRRLERAFAGQEP